MVSDLAHTAASGGSAGHQRCNLRWLALHSLPRSLSAVVQRLDSRLFLILQERGPTSAPSCRPLCTPWCPWSALRGGCTRWHSTAPLHLQPPSTSWQVGFTWLQLLAPAGPTAPARCQPLGGSQTGPPLDICRSPQQTAVHSCGCEHASFEQLTQLFHPCCAAGGLVNFSVRKVAHMQVR